MATEANGTLKPLTLSNSVTVRDDAGNDLTGIMTSLTGNTVVVDTTAPSMTLAVQDSNSNTISNGGLTNQTSFTVLFVPNEPIINFTKDDIDVTNGTLDGDLQTITQGGNTSYSISLNATSGGSETAISVDAGKFTDAAGNNNSAIEHKFTSDSTPPTMTITAKDQNNVNDVNNGDTTNDNTLKLTFTSSKTTTTFVKSDINFEMEILALFSGSGSAYTATFTPTGDGNCTIDVPSGVYTDAFGNNNSAATQFVWIRDTVSTNCYTFIQL